MRRIALILAVLLVVPFAPSASAQDEVPNVLAWTATYGFRHPSITNAVSFLNELADAGEITLTNTENPQDMTADNLRQYDAVVWVSTTGKPPMTQDQRDGIMRYAACGGGTLGFHAALDANYGWDEHAHLFGAQFDSHPQGAGDPEARMFVEDDGHPITVGWAGVEDFMLQDEYYRWRSAKNVPGVSLPRNYADTHVLLSLDETTVREGIQESEIPYEDDQPIAWTKTYGEGRVYYNNIGHNESSWDGLEPFRTSVLEGINWVSEVALDEACLDAEGPLPEQAGPPAADPALVGTECVIPELGVRSGGTWEVTGEARALTPEGDSQQVAGGLTGGFQWGAQTWYLDLSSVGASTATVTFDVTWPNPLDDYDMSVTTAWGFYGSNNGFVDGSAMEEQVVIEDVPQCAYLHVTADPGVTVSQGPAGPTITATVVPDQAVELPSALRITSASSGPSDLAQGWSAVRGSSDCGCALIARDDDFADALASGGAQFEGAPLLLTDGSSLSDGVAEELARLGVSEVTVLGGTAAVSAAVEQELRDLGLTVERAGGVNRIATAVAIAEATFETVEQAPLLLRAFSGEEATAGFADSLAAGREAARTGRPVLLTDTDGLSQETADYLTAAGISEVVIVGGTAAVSDRVVLDLLAIGVTATRVAGDNRFATAVAVATELGGVDSAANAEGVVLLDGVDPAAWAEGFVAASSPRLGPIVLSNGADVPSETADWIGAVDSTVPLTCGALVATAACDTVAASMGLE